MQRLNIITIDPTNMSPDEQRILGAFLISQISEFVNKSIDKQGHNKNNAPYISYGKDSQGFRLTHNLCIDTQNNDPNKKYFVYSNADGDVRGTGSYNKVRCILGVLDIAADGPPLAKYTPTKAYAVRISNHKQVEDVCTHESVERQYKKAQAFPHLGMRVPVKRVPLTVGPGFFSKSYTVMHAFEGEELDWAFNYLNTLQQMVALTLTVLETYKKQVADQNHIHRDIKPDNIMANMKTNPPTVNFIDMDFAMKIDTSIEDAWGTPGYIAPELKNFLGGDNNTIIATQKFDIWSLGITLIECWNQNLSPRKITDKMLGHETTDWREDMMAPWKAAEQAGSYLQYIINNYAHYRQFKFSYYVRSAISPDHEKVIQDIFKAMTSYDPTRRPNIDEAIGVFERIQNERLSPGHTLAP